jgi:hypothetical protein
MWKIIRYNGMDSNESFSVRRDLEVKATSNFVNRRPVAGFRARGFGEIFHFSQANTETQHQTRYDHLFTYPSQFIIHQMS